MKQNIFFRLGRSSKVKLNYLLDRVVDLSNMVLMDVYRLPWPMVQSIARKVARYAGDISELLRAFPRLDAHKLTGPNWTVIFVGKLQDLLEIRHLFFSEEVIHQEIGRIALWKLPFQTRKWLAEGVDLVVCELSRIHPNRPKAPITFIVPTWIHQLLAIPEPVETLIAGKKFANKRNTLNKARQAGFNVKFTRSKADFDHFYYHMYRPYLETRHGELALTASYQDQRQRWFERGGLLLITDRDKPIAGALCHMAGETCFHIETGVLKADPQLFKQRIETVIVWYAIIWGRDQGAKIFDMGGTRPWRANGSFASKQRWGAQVVRRRKIYSTWAFFAQNLSPSLHNHINQLGFISEIDGKFYRILLDTEVARAPETYLQNGFATTASEGMDGLLVILPDRHQIIPLHNADQSA
jgi:hypothetical protein